MTTLELRGHAYDLEVLRGTELSRVIPLFRDAFAGREFKPDWLRRKYSCQHAGLEGFACVAFDEQGDPAGSVGVLPWPVRFEDRVETAGQMVDVATHSAHRGRGLFVALADRAREVCEAAGVGFLYGFPNEEAYPIWVHKLGYEHTQDLGEYRRRVRTIWAEKLSHRARPLRRLYERYLDRKLGAAAAPDPLLANSFATEGFAHIERDRTFHMYKSTFDGSRVLATEGGRAWVKVRHALMIGDLEAQSDSDLELTARALAHLSSRLGVHEIVLQASKETRLSDFFTRRFEVSRDLPVIYRNLRSEIPKEKLRFTLGDLDNF